MRSGQPGRMVMVGWLSRFFSVRRWPALSPFCCVDSRMARTPFHITRNELAVAEERRTERLLLRLWNFARKPRAFELHPPLNAHNNAHRDKL